MGGDGAKAPMRGKWSDERVGSLRLIDDRFMRVCLKNRPDCLELLARIALDDDELRIVDVRDQEELPSLAGHGVRLDFLCKTADGRSVDVEVETTTDEFPPRRARYYSAMADATLLPSGQGYDALPDFALVVFCGGDAFGLGRKLYAFRRADEDGLSLGDGSVIMYVNCTVHDDTPLGWLSHDLMCADPDMMHYRLLADCVRAAKDREAGMNVLDEVFEEGRAEGETRAVFSLFRKGAITAQSGAEELGMDEERFLAEVAADASLVQAAS